MTFVSGSAGMGRNIGRNLPVAIGIPPFMKQSIFFVSLIALSTSACTPSSDQGNTTGNVAPAGNIGKSGPADDSANSVAPPAADTLSPGNTESASPLAEDSKIIGLEGLGALRIGRPVPTGSGWSERGAQTGDDCRTVSSPDYPGVYAIVTDGKVQRITVGRRSDVKLAEGIGVGANEKDVGKWFAGFRAEPHKYENAPAKYLTAPNAGSGDPALRFEIGSDGRVSFIHVGMMPVLAYVEGCA